MTQRVDDELKSLCDAASPAPWRVRHHPKYPLRCHVEGHRPQHMGYALEVLGDDYTGFGGDEQRRRDVRFVAAAREFLPALLIERDALNAEMADLKERVHYAEGTAELAMKHRDIAETAVATARAEGRRKGLEEAEAKLQSKLEVLIAKQSEARERHDQDWAWAHGEQCAAIVEMADVIRALANPTEDAG